MKNSILLPLSEDLLLHMYRAYVEDSSAAGVKDIMSFDKWKMMLVNHG